MKEHKNTEIYHIAIDGPVASGKGTVAHGLAEKLGIPTLDTGAMYRAAAVYMLDNKISDSDETAVVGALQGFKIDVCVTNAGTKVAVNGTDVTGRIRENVISQMSSNISRFPAVRAKMVAAQQEIARSQSFILEGRDIASVVLPDARFKFYLTAKLKTRAMRRRAELLSRGIEISLPEMMRQIKHRDTTDMHKKVGALRRVRGAIVVDNTNLTREQTVDKFLKIVVSAI
jgi:cytidylate kinase